MILFRISFYICEPCELNLVLPEMALMGLVRRLPAFPVFQQPALLSPGLQNLALAPPSTPFAFPISRSYMKNFEEENTGHRPVSGWRNQNRRHFQGRLYYVNRMTFDRHSEVKQRRKTGYEHRMASEGGRRVILRKILRGKDVLGGES